MFVEKILGVTIIRVQIELIPILQNPTTDADGVGVKVAQAYFDLAQYKSCLWLTPTKFLTAR
jgi:hypothetical protein